MVDSDNSTIGNSVRERDIAHADRSLGADQEGDEMGNAEGADSTTNAEDADFGSGRLQRKRQLEKRRRDDFKEAFDKLNNILMQHDEGFRLEAKQREERVLWRASNRGTASHKASKDSDNSLFNRVEMVNQAVATIGRLVAENERFKQSQMISQSDRGEFHMRSGIGALGTRRTGVDQHGPTQAARSLLGAANEASLLASQLHQQSPYLLGQQQGAMPASFHYNNLLHGLQPRQHEQSQHLGAALGGMSASPFPIQHMMGLPGLQLGRPLVFNSGDPAPTPQQNLSTSTNAEAASSPSTPPPPCQPGEPAMVVSDESSIPKRSPRERHRER